MTVKFQDLRAFCADDVEAAIARDAPDELPFVPITIAISSTDIRFAAAVCSRLVPHRDPKVRGYAIMSLGHLARRFQELDETLVRPLIEHALNDNDELVRDLATSAADEIHQFLHWTFSGHVYGASGH